VRSKQICETASLTVTPIGLEGAGQHFG